MGFEEHITTLEWDDSTPLDYDEALARLVSEFRASGEPVNVSTYDSDGDLEATFTARLRGAFPYDPSASGAIGLQFDGAQLVLSRRRFESAAWLERAGCLRAAETAVRFCIDGRHIEFTHP